MAELPPPLSFLLPPSILPVHRISWGACRNWRCLGPTPDYLPTGNPRRWGVGHRRSLEEVPSGSRRGAAREPEGTSSRLLLWQGGAVLVEWGTTKDGTALVEWPHSVCCKFVISHPRHTALTSHDPQALECALLALPYVSANSPPPLEVHPPGHRGVLWTCTHSFSWNWCSKGMMAAFPIQDLAIHIEHMLTITFRLVIYDTDLMIFAWIMKCKIEFVLVSYLFWLRRKRSYWLILCSQRFLSNLGNNSHCRCQRIAPSISSYTFERDIIVKQLQRWTFPILCVILDQWLHVSNPISLCAK